MQKEETQLLKPSPIRIEADDLLKRLEKILDKPLKVEINVQGRLDDLPLDKLQHGLDKLQHTLGNIQAKLTISVDDAPVRRLENTIQSACNVLLIVVVVWAVTSLLLRLIK